MYAHTHLCAVPGCTWLVLPKYLMCLAHWALVPRELQDDLYRLRCSSRLDPTYISARTRAIEAIRSAGEVTT